MRGSGYQLPAAVTIADTDVTMTNPALRERYEGMRVRFASLTAVAPTGGTVGEKAATVSSDGTFAAVSSTMPRPFREPGLGPG